MCRCGDVCGGVVMCVGVVMYVEVCWCVSK